MANDLHVQAQSKPKEARCSLPVLVLHPRSHPDPAPTSRALLKKTCPDKPAHKLGVLCPCWGLQWPQPCTCPPSLVQPQVMYLNAKAGDDLVTKESGADGPDVAQSWYIVNQRMETLRESLFPNPCFVCCGCRSFHPFPGILRPQTAENFFMSKSGQLFNLDIQ